MSEKVDTLYEHCYYLMKETKKPTHLDFYELEDKDLRMLDAYEKQTVRYQGKWFFVTYRKQYFYSEESQKNAPRVYIKYLYKKPMPYNFN